MTTNRRHSPALRAYRSGTAVASLVPPAVSRGIAAAAGVVASRGSQLSGRLGRFGPGSALHERRTLVACHLRRVCGEGISRRQLDRMVDDAFASYGRYWAESLRLPSLSATEVRAHMRYDRWDRIQAGIDAGRGTILAVPHLGGWEWAGTQLALTGHPISVVVERLNPPDLFDWFVAFRERLGMRVIPVGPQAASQCMKALADNHILCLLSDRIVGGAAGVDVEFFGEVTQLPAGAATLALRTGATLLPCAVFFDGRNDHIGAVREPVSHLRSGRLRDDVRVMTQQLASDFEIFIRRAPTQWHLMQPNWPSDPGWSRR